MADASTQGDRKGRILPLTSSDLRSTFLRYFSELGHTVVPSSSLIPQDDPTLLFTNAGMVQFKDVFLGLSKRPYHRATTAQKCVRAGGKHNDLDAVGRTARHHTFFEMLGNFSFGDYFKDVAIEMAWRFVTDILDLPRGRLYFSVFEEDDEAERLWRKVAGATPDRIARMGAEDNFWQMGDTGPCGPDSELWFDRGESAAHGPGCHFPCECGRFVEFWNLVFMQYDRDASGTLTPLPKPSVDTGLGFERAVSILEGVPTNWDTDIFRPLLAKISDMAGRPLGDWEEGFPMRVIADHVRSGVFLIADGVLPANEGRGYVLRRILRRAVLKGRELGLPAPFLPSLQAVVGETMGDAYPEILGRASLVRGVLAAEEERFARTLAEGSEILREALGKLPQGGVLPGERAFALYDTYGFPFELTEEITGESGRRVDRAGFERLLEEQRRRAREARQETYAVSAIAEATENLPATEFLGYREMSSEAEVLFVEAPSGRGEMETVGILLDRTPFYGEGGGQVGDTGRLIGERGAVEIVDTRRLPGGRILHVARGVPPRPGEKVRASVDEERRRSVMRNHTATHLLHRSLRETLGDHVHQAGSVVEPSRLRFDFTHFQALTEDEIREVEERVNGWILEDRPVTWTTMPLAEAKERGAMALFEEKYGDVVRVVTVEGVSEELCGGTHVGRTGEIGLFRIAQETSAAGGIRRITATTARGVLKLLEEREKLLTRLESALRAPRDQLPERVREIEERALAAEERLRAGRLGELRGLLETAMGEALEVGKARLTRLEVDEASPGELRSLADLWREKERRGILAMVAPQGDRVNLLLAATASLVGEGFDSKAAFAALAGPTEGRGGGRGELVQGSGKKAEGSRRALSDVARAVTDQMDRIESREGRTGT